MIQEEMVGLTVMLRNEHIEIVSKECARTEHKFGMKSCKVCRGVKNNEQKKL
jgi:hypothetical protein